MPTWREAPWKSDRRSRLRDQRGGVAFALAVLVITALSVIGLLFAGSALGAW